MKSDKHIEEKDLDKMMNDLFLQENAEVVNDDSAKFVFSQEYDVKMDVSKQDQLLKKLNKNLGGLGNAWAFGIAGIMIIAGGIVYFGLANIKSQKNTSANTSQLAANIVDTSSLIDTSFKLAFTDNETLWSDSTQHISSTPESTHLQKDSIINLAFNPTPDEYKFYQEEKVKMIETLVNTEKNMYSSVEKGKIVCRGQDVKLESFVIRNQSITNLEYKIFLADLLKAGKVKQYKEAFVKSWVWNNYAQPLLARTYFYDERYNNFPVVNISTKAATLFCQWLTEEVNAYLLQYRIKSKFEIRLPFDSEWIYATKQGYIHFSDCGGYNTVYDRKEGVVDEYYLKWVEKIEKKDKRKPVEQDASFAVNRFGMSEKQVLNIFGLGEAISKNFVADSTYSFKVDLFNKVGHVSEMLYEQGTNKAMFVGACWKDKREYLQMAHGFKKESASPYVGFRIIILNSNKISYQGPI